MNMRQKLKIAQFRAFSEELRKIAGITPLPMLQKLVKPKVLSQVAGAAEHAGQARSAIGQAGRVSPAADPRAMGMRAAQLEAAAKQLETNYANLPSRTVRLDPKATVGNYLAKQKALQAGRPQSWMTA